MRIANAAACRDCGAGFLRRSPTHRYCEACSAARQAERQRKWARDNPPPKDVAQKNKRDRSSAAVVYGAQRSAQERESISWNPSEAIELDWVVRVSVPFEYSFSKNHLFTNRPGGHVAMRRGSRAVRDNLTKELWAALHQGGIAPVPGKLWIDLLVQKTNHRGDAVNVIDLVCDAIKDAAGVDDRWFSIRRLDWQIIKVDPRIYVGIGQEFREPAQCCSCCGRALPYAAFTKSRSTKSGISRNCRECESEGRKRVPTFDREEEYDDEAE